MIYDCCHCKKVKNDAWIVPSLPGKYRLFPTLAYVNHALRRDFLSIHKFHHTIRFSDVPLYVSAISTGLKYAAGIITVNIDKGDTHGPGTVSVDMAPLLRLSIDSPNRGVMFKIIWVASSFGDRNDKQRDLLGSILAAPKEPAPYQTSWLNYFASTVDALLVYARVEEVPSKSQDSHALHVCVVVKKESAEKWMMRGEFEDKDATRWTTRGKIEDKDATRWATESGYPIDLLSITSFSTT